MKKIYFFEQAELLLQILPFFKQEKVFALKGGTAINFFYRNLPRLSVDIDLTYIPINKREIALADISQRLGDVSKRIINRFPNCDIVSKTLPNARIKYTIGLIIKRENTSIKIEPNFVVRGSVYPVENKKLSTSVIGKFELEMQVQTLSFADLYGSKICAALDRQHPRDLFDVHILLQNEGITEKIRKAFIVYLISHPRPIVELLDPNPQEISNIYKQEFQDMMVEHVSLEDLIQTQNYLTQNIKNLLTNQEKEFLISFKSLNPQWHLSGLENIEQLPSVKWKLFNLKRMSKTKHQQAVEKLRNLLT